MEQLAACFFCGREAPRAELKLDYAGFCGKSGKQLFCVDADACEDRFWNAAADDILAAFDHADLVKAMAGVDLDEGNFAALGELLP